MITSLLAPKNRELLQLLLIESHPAQLREARLMLRIRTKGRRVVYVDHHGVVENGAVCSLQPEPFRRLSVLLYESLPGRPSADSL
jgi:hypothetical protein